MIVQWSAWQVGSGPERALWLKPGPGRRARRACTVSEACRLLRRSRRQVYRLMREGVVEARGKFLGEWLLDHASLERLRDRPAQRQRLPRSFQPLFPEYDAATLNPGRDREVVLSRLLEHGGLRGIRWALRRFSAAELGDFLREDGARTLTPRTLGFWSLFLGMPTPEKPAWRRQGWAWGGSV